MRDKQLSQSLMRKNRSHSLVFKDVGDHSNRINYMTRERRYRDKQNAKNCVGNLTRIQPFDGRSVEHNNFSRDFKPVNFLPCNHRPVSVLHILTRSYGLRAGYGFVLFLR